MVVDILYIVIEAEDRIYFTILGVKVCKCVKK